MRDYISKTIVCPHCGHHTSVDIDASQGDQDFYEECMACYNDIHLHLHHIGSATVLACRREQDRRNDRPEAMD